MALVGVLGVALYPKPPIEPAPPVLMRNRYNDPPDQTLHQQIFS